MSIAEQRRGVQGQVLSAVTLPLGYQERVAYIRRRLTRDHIGVLQVCLRMGSLGYWPASPLTATVTNEWIVWGVLVMTAQGVQFTEEGKAILAALLTDVRVGV